MNFARSHAAAAMLVLGAWGAAATACAAGAEWMMQAEVDGVRLEGRPLHLSQSRVELLLRDGSVVQFNAPDARNARKSAPSFRPYTAGELRARLSAEFGNDFEVTGVGRYLVVHPRGQRDQWAERFENLYRSFRHYFQVRGFKLQEPDFPLVAVVWPDEATFRAYAQREGANISRDTIGYYSPKTNRVMLYDSTRSGGDWTQNADTVIHEVTHQSAFNTGVHNRFGQTPRWLAEGLATMFEPRGVWNSAQHQSQADRINRGRLRDFQRYAANQHRDGDLAGLIESDRFFDADPQRGYALAWALSFYLVETQPQRYSQYLARTAARDAAQPYGAAARRQDFTESFGADLRLTEAQFLRYMANIR